MDRGHQKRFGKRVVEPRGLLLNEVDAIPWFVKRVVEREISFTPEVSREEILERIIGELKRMLDLSRVPTADQ